MPQKRGYQYLEINMADVTISQLTQGTPAGSGLIPFSTGSSTLAVPASAILQNVGNVGVGTVNPSSKLTISGAVGASGQGRFAGWYNSGDMAGLAAEIGTSGGEGYLYAYNRSTSTYAPINIATGNTGLKFRTDGVIDVTGKLNSPTVAKAWVVFSGFANSSPPAAGTDISNKILSQFNISSLTYVSTIQIRATFTTPFQNSNYCVVGNSSGNNQTYNFVAGISTSTTNVTFYLPSLGGNGASNVLPTGNTSIVIYSN